jgi:hypothetical protein
LSRLANACRSTITSAAAAAPGESAATSAAAAADIAKVLTADEARRIAANIAKLPALLGSALPEDAVNNLSDERHNAEDTTPE